MIDASLVQGHPINLSVEVYEDAAAFFVTADSSIDSVAWPAGGPDEWVWTDYSDVSAYIPPAAGPVPPHLLPGGAGIAFLKRSETWACPSEQTFSEAFAAICKTTNLAELTQPGLEKARHLLGLLVGGWQAKTTPHKDTRIEWWRDYFDTNLGGSRRRGFYHGTLEGRDANGISNLHYHRLFYMTVALCLADHQDRMKAWAFYVQQAVRYVMTGRYNNGPLEGYSRGEKGDVFVGRRTDGTPTDSYAKDWVTNLIGPLLLTGNSLFRRALERAADFYSAKNLTTVWGGAWGARIPARILENMLTLWHLLPEYRFSLEAQMRQMVDILAFYYDRAEALWPNLGNRGKGPISPWMQSEAVAVWCRVQEQVPNLKGYGGLTRSDMAACMERMTDTTRGTDGGSEMVNGWPLFRYRMVNNTGDPMNARFPSSTAFGLAALRFLQRELPSQYEKVRAFCEVYTGSTLVEVWNGTPRDMTTLGYRDPSQGPAWPKTLMAWIDAWR